MKPASQHPAVTGSTEPIGLSARRGSNSQERKGGKKVSAGGVMPGTSYDVDDEVFFRHGEGPRAGRVVSRGKHGCTIDEPCGSRHQVAWDRFLGLKGRTTYPARVVDRGAGGAILERADGRRFFVSGDVPMAEEPDALTWDESGAPLDLAKSDPVDSLGQAIAGWAERCRSVSYHHPQPAAGRPLLFVGGGARVP